MALQVDGTTVVNDSRQLQNLDDTDSITRLTIADSLRYNDNKIEIQDSSGNAVHTIFGTD